MLFADDINTSVHYQIITTSKFKVAYVYFS